MHEDRLLALIILTAQFADASTSARRALYTFYLQQRRRVNNWDLVDTSAAPIVGAYLFETKVDRKILYELVGSATLWDRRIAVVATHYFIRQHEFDDTLRLAHHLLDDREDLMHKAVGWMLREVGKRDVRPLKTFLNQHRHVMPRTMLRYAIERFPETERRAYLAKKAR
jgi:3-methyladenine DNA glycosylase AlkD